VTPAAHAAAHAVAIATTLPLRIVTSALPFLLAHQRFPGVTAGNDHHDRCTTS